MLDLLRAGDQARIADGAGIGLLGDVLAGTDDGCEDGVFLVGRVIDQIAEQALQAVT